MSGSNQPFPSPIVIGKNIGRYRIVSLLGEGGMGKVYRAFDPELGREVALKVLADGSSSAARLSRLRTEGRAAAALNHPNIVAVYDIGQSDGVDYIVTEVVEGPTLATLLPGRPLPLTTALDIAVPIAEALAAAHAAGVVHRDLKPSNVLLTQSGVPKIADFGLAKFNESSSGNASQLNTFDIADRTAEGVIVGTAAYMSPEQARGEAVDFHCDQFAFGAMLYEMLTGRRAFQRNSVPETLAAVITEAPPPDALAPAPEKLRKILARCLQKDPRLRYGATDDLAHDLAECRGQPPSPARSAVSRPVLIGLFSLAVMVAVVLGWLRIADKPLQPVPVTPAATPSLAVLPFRNAGADPSMQHFGLGLADAITGELAALKSVTVRPTSTVAQFEGQSVDAIRAGRQLGVTTVLEGTFQRVNGGLQVTAQLSDVRRSAILWGTRLQVPEGELFKLQDAASQAIADALRLRVSPEQRRSWSHQSRVSDAAVEEYLSLRPSLLGLPRGSPELRQRLIASLSSILEREPDFAPALGARALVESITDFFEPSGEWRARAEADADRALALDSSLVEPRLARAHIFYSSSGGWRVFDALNEYLAAVHELPGSELAHINLAFLYRHLGWLDKFEAEIRAIHAINPANNEAMRLHASILGELGQCQESLAAFQKVKPGKGDAVPIWQAVAVTRFHCGEVHPLREELEARYSKSNHDSLEHPMTAALLGLARVRDGVTDVAALEHEALSADQRAGHFHHTSLVLAEIHALQGDRRNAVRFLRQTADTGMPMIAGFERDSFLASVRTSDEYRALITELRRREPPH